MNNGILRIPLYTANEGSITNRGIVLDLDATLVSTFDTVPNKNALKSMPKEIQDRIYFLYFGNKDPVH